MFISVRINCNCGSRLCFHFLCQVYAEVIYHLKKKYDPMISIKGCFDLSSFLWHCLCTATSWILKTSARMKRHIESIVCISITVVLTLAYLWTFREINKLSMNPSSAIYINSKHYYDFKLDKWYSMGGRVLHLWIRCRSRRIISFLCSYHSLPSRFHFPLPIRWFMAKNNFKQWL